MWLKRRSDSKKYMIVITVDIVMTRETAQLMGKLVTDVVERTTLKRNASKSLTPGPRAMGGGVKVVEMYASAAVPKEGTLMKLVVKTAMMRVVVKATKWRICWNRFNLFSITKSMKDGLNV